MAERTDPPHSSRLDIDVLLKQARSYLAFGTAMLDPKQQGLKCDPLQAFSAPFYDALSQGGDWGQAVRQHFDQLKTTLSGTADEPSGHPELAHLWNVTLDTWQQIATTLVPATLAPPADPHSLAWQTYQRIQGQTLDLLRQSAKEALDLMEQRLKERAATGATVESLRELYNLWVECNEDTYGRMLRGEKYGELNGCLLNALLSCYACGDAPT